VNMMPILGLVDLTPSHHRSSQLQLPNPNGLLSKQSSP